MTRTCVPRLRLLTCPGRDRMANPYIRLYTLAMEKHGFIYAGELVPKCLSTPSSWNDVTSRADVIHFQFPAGLWRTHDHRALSALRRRMPSAHRLISRLLNPLFHVLAVSRVDRFITTVRARSVVVWTCHDLHHPVCNAGYDRKAFGTLARKSHLVIVHTRSAAEEFRSIYGSDNVIIMPHGNYDGVFSQAAARDEILRKFGLPEDRPLVSCIGLLRASKGQADLVDAALRLPQLHVLIAGRPNMAFDLGWFQQQVARAPNCTLIARTLTDLEVAELITVSEAVVLPYHQITTSGALLTALTLGRAVVATDLPFFREILGPSTSAGVLVPVGDPQGLAKGILRLLEIPSCQRSSAARAIADRYNWTEVVRPVADEIRRVWAQLHSGDAVKAM